MGIRSVRGKATCAAAALVVLAGPGMALLAAAPGDACAEAERLLSLARRGQFTDPQAAQAAGLLAHEDPFIAAIAEWALATRVEKDNGGQRIAWPREDAPAWFVAWASLPAERLLEFDYARYAVSWGAHRQAAQLLSSAGKIIERAEGAAGEVRQAAGLAERKALVAGQLEELRAIERRLAEHVRKDPGDLLTARRLWLAARRAARPIVLANPAIDFDSLIYIKRHPVHSHRNITGSQYPWVHKPGGDIFIQSLPRGLGPGARIDPVIAGRLGPGHVHGMDLWWDADRVVFAWARQEQWPPKWDTVAGNDVFRLRGEQEPTHLYEIDLRGGGPRQITDHPYWSDFEPTYLADGQIAFASDRSGRSSECGKFSADHTVINLYAVRGDGSGLRRLSDNKDIDRYPHSLDDGSIAYTRWDYQERHFFETHAVWTVRPDGTLSDAVFNQHLKYPFGLRDTRSIPHSRKLVSIATGHHTLAYGPVVVVDPQWGINAGEAIGIVTPGVRPQEGGMSGSPVPGGGVRDRDGVYQTPWALSETCFLASYSHTPQPTGTGGGGNSAGFAIYVIDAHGNRELIARDPLLSCSFPIPLRKRPRPPVLTDTTVAERPYATCYVTDVYDGTSGLRRGEVRFLRIAQRVGWPLDDSLGAMRWIPGNAWSKQFGFWSWAPVRVIGTVDVEADGSAHFQVPTDTAVYFQALDADRMELWRMRSHVTFQPGEVRGCRGCHESQGRAPLPTGRVPLALRREARRPTPPPWGDRRLLGYEWLVQPVLDRHCVRCHCPGKRDDGLDFTATRAGDGFLQSYRTMFALPPDAAAGKGPKRGRVLVKVSNRLGGSEVSKRKEFGSHASRLIEVLRTDAEHRRNVRLSDEEWQALVTWVDTNAPYHDTFYNRRPDGGGGPVRNVLLELPPAFTAGTDWSVRGVIAVPRSEAGTSCRP
ncbi:MAG TPA: hypothetical protein VM695_10925 [Phycisphaerae bacterium]|nr:hypothetical protein [Phycisphaerae bacterium]